jgi:transposase
LHNQTVKFIVKGMTRPKQELKIKEEEKLVLEELVRAKTSTQREVFRAKIILQCSEGFDNTEVAEGLQTSVNTVGMWRRRFICEGLSGLVDAPGRGRKIYLSTDKLKKVIDEAVIPPKGRSHWSCRQMSKHAGVSKSQVHKIWRDNEIKPHIITTFKLSKDKNFEQKFWDVVGIYLNPPDKAVVLCCDEKSQIQALERTRKNMPLSKGHPETQTHDYKRNGTVTLFAALDYLEGKIFAETKSKHTNVEWLDFLKEIDKQVPADQQVHLILDNYGTHKHPNVMKWLEDKKRFHLHFVPTSSSWMNMVERFFRDITQDSIRRGSFSSVEELTKTIFEYIEEHNLHPKRYVWKAKGQKILDKIKRAREVYDNL